MGAATSLMGEATTVQPRRRLQGRTLTGRRRGAAHVLALRVHSAACVSLTLGESRVPSPGGVIFQCRTNDQMTVTFGGCRLASLTRQNMRI
jgi:hypothetical protein